ncbi:MAG: hypothetical protein ACREXT_13750, partial [Gammaproteobacteria bacterium]
MSLLMDALRKAEADKQAARAAGAEVSTNEIEVISSSGELRLEPLAESTADRVPLGRSGEFASSELE